MNAQLQRTRQQQRSEWFQRMRCDAEAVDSTDESTTTRLDQSAAAPAASDDVDVSVFRFNGSADSDQERSESFERLLLLVKPSQRPFDQDDTMVPMPRDTDADEASDANGSDVLQSTASSDVVLQYLDRTHSIESLRSSTSASFRLGTIPVRESTTMMAVAGNDSASSANGSTAIEGGGSATTADALGGDGTAMTTTTMVMMLNGRQFWMRHGLMVAITSLALIVAILSAMRQLYFVGN